jgi:pimeloyl-ACP methyl ester carboxylesterase
MTRLFSLDHLIERLTESTSLTLAQQIQAVDIAVPLGLDPEVLTAITTTFVCQKPNQQPNQESNLGLNQPQPLVLLHGFDSSVFEFRRLLPLLAQHHPTWAIDLLGFGFTDRIAGIPVSPEAIKTHLYYSWKTLIGQPMVLVGASMGGAAAIDFALSYPEAVERLVLIDSAGFTAGPALGKYLLPPLGYLATAFLRRPHVRQQVSLKAYHDPSYASPDALACAALHLEQTGWSQSLIAFTRSGGYGSFQARLAQLQPQTLILWGRQDRILGIADAPRFEQAIPQSQLVWIADAGHVPHLEKPQETSRVILDFLSIS